jgi:hypothetical protein
MRSGRLASPQAVSLLALALSLAVLAGCGSAGSTTSDGATRGAGVTAAAAKTIDDWAVALRTGHPLRAAAAWALPSAMVNGPDASGQITVIHIHSAHDALIADETLSCGATLRKTTRSGPYIRAEFTLSVRSGPGASKSGCSGPAAVDFLIRKQRIVRWLRAPDGSGGSAAPPTAEPSGPGEPNGPGGPSGSGEAGEAVEAAPGAQSS